MTIVGIIVNPASGQDIRRLTTQASVFGNPEKVQMVRRALVGLAATGVQRVWIMPDAYGFARRVLDGFTLAMEVSLLPMPTQFDQEDSRRAAALMAAAGAGCLITFGGDGTNRAVAKGCGEVPLLPLSTGTNNVFPIMTEATTAGLAAGLVARGLADEAVVRAPRIEVFRCPDDQPPGHLADDAEPDDLALVDAAVYDEWFIGARAVTDMARVKALVLARVEPGVIGLAAIGAHLTGGDPRPDRGLFLRLGAGGQPVIAPIAPGMVQTVFVTEQRPLASGEGVTARQERAWVLALDGEREWEMRAGTAVRLRFNANGPRVIDPRRALTVAARAGVFRAETIAVGPG